ncbi:hypothetical protein ACFPL7_21505 [Dongia soli]|uniref:Uncharacterized protein n=1 Tax=Dongia soli TaxID=600628 RepID=A0ABU5E9E3_9PROT|nr:hypothetical protein [Dongia soli]MDY0882168.1 hypothetical protein [Dongia soli]
MANSIGAFSANILARFNAAYTAGQSNTSSQGSTSSQGAASSATSTSDTIAKLKSAIGDASSPSNAGNDAVILNLSAAAQQLLASLQSGNLQSGSAPGDAGQNGGAQNSLAQTINQQIANQPSLASYLTAGQDTTVNGLNFMNGFGTGGSDAANGFDALGAVGDASGAIEQFQQWLSQPLQANLERAIERQKESSPLNEEKSEDKSKAPDQTAADTSSPTDSASSAGDAATTSGSTAGSNNQASASSA